MSLSPLHWFRRKSANPTRNQGGEIAVSLRATQPLGPWTDVFAGVQPRAVSPWLYEALKEAVPLLDGGLGRMVTLDGIIDVEGDNDALVDEIRDWMRSVPVNDVETGYQAAYSSQGEELYEQGHGIIEYVMDAKGRDVIGLRVADSKGTAFVRGEDRMRIFYRAPAAHGDTRPDGLSNIQNILRGNVAGRVTSSILGDLGYVELDPMQLVMAVHRPEADNPYGTSLLRSVPFVAQTILRLQNATARTWERFGDPSFHVNYSTKARGVDRIEAQRRASQVAQDLGAALAGKARGNSVDIATGSGADDSISISVIGAVGETLEIEMPARHLIEQVLAAFPVAPWMLGVSWSQAAGIGEPQSELVLQDARTRFARREPALRRPIEAMLRGRGRRWKQGDWKLVQHLPSLHDEVKRAQAEFLREQARMMRGEAPVDGAISPRGLDNTLRSARTRSSAPSRVKAASDDEREGEPWAEDDEQLPVIERRAISAMLGTWRATRRQLLDSIGLDSAAPEFRFDLAGLPALLALETSTTAGIHRALVDAAMAAWERGLRNAEAEVPPPVDGERAAHAPATKHATKASWWEDDEFLAAIESLRARVRAEIARSGMELVRPGVARTLRWNIVNALASGEFDGQNPLHVAQALRQRFDAGEYNWERLARSEIAIAQSNGKLDMYREAGVTRYDYQTAEDEKVSAICRALADGGPYQINDPNAPVPVTSSHPNCRCTVRARG